MTLALILGGGLSLLPWLRKGINFSELMSPYYLVAVIVAFSIGLVIWPSRNRWRFYIVCRSLAHIWLTLSVTYLVYIVYEIMFLQNRWAGQFSGELHKEIIAAFTLFPIVVAILSFGLMFAPAALISTLFMRED